MIIRIVKLLYILLNYHTENTESTESTEMFCPAKVVTQKTQKDFALQNGCHTDDTDEHR